jgi:hypothetical protein
VCGGRHAIPISEAATVSVRQASPHRPSLGQEVRQPDPAQEEVVMDNTHLAIIIMLVVIIVALLFPRIPR